jgi:hypothetical protein
LTDVDWDATHGTPRFPLAAYVASCACTVEQVVLDSRVTAFVSDWRAAGRGTVGRLGTGTAWRSDGDGESALACIPCAVHVIVSARVDATMT